MTHDERRCHPARVWIDRTFIFVEDAVYVGLGLVLAFSAVSLLVSGAVRIVEGTAGHAPPVPVIDTLDRILLVLLVIELLYTVRVSFRERAILPEPFLLAGLIAAVRRVLVLTAEYGERHGRPDLSRQDFVTELLALTGLILVLVLSLVLLRKADAARPAGLTGSSGPAW